uniref:Uba and ubx domain-containing protein n=1 Tax=Tetraselmis sp. GSL018 TaxID=582737 RepID=A0A061RG05_9CHLO
MSNVRGLGDYRSGDGSSGGGRRPGSSSNIRGFGDYSGGGRDSDDESNELYTGGEKSGMVVKGRPLDDDQGGGVEGIFNSARQHGAQVGGAEDLARARGELQPPQRFTGTARTLDGRVQPVAPSEDHGPRAHTITFYSNGVFTIDDGPARSVSDPQNTDLINSISRGECPQELAPENSTIPVSTVGLSVLLAPWLPSFSTCCAGCRGPSRLSTFAQLPTCRFLLRLSRSLLGRAVVSTANPQLLCLVAA